MIFKSSEKDVAGYFKRSNSREITLMKATMSLVGYFMSLGDTQEAAEIKVTELSTESAAFLFVYTLGNKQPLIDCINASNLVHMDATAKAYLIGLL